MYSEEKYNEVVQKFRSKWSGVKGECPPVNYIFEVNNVTLLNQWSGYMGTLSVQTVEEHFHGTSLACHLAVNKKLCSSPKCGICGISGRGLDRMCIGTKINFQRFGDGFYLAPNSSKCHDYTEGAHNLRAMLLCDVCPGRKHQLQHKSETLSRPPPGFDSVIGIVGKELHFPEIVLFEPKAVMPRYIIMYTKDGVTHPLRK